jgi:CIC family chloride channel protein
MSNGAHSKFSLNTWLFRKLSSRQFLFVGAVVVGLWAGLSAVLLKASVHYLLTLLAPVAQTYNWVYFISPTVGIFLTYLFIKIALKGDMAKGTSHVMMAIAKKSSFLPKIETYSHLVTSALTVGLGGSAGLESPIVQTGSAIGSTFSSFFPVGYRERTLLLACGAAAGIATAFNAPFAGVLFALEVLLVDVNISAFIPLLISGATGALCSKVILSEGILLSSREIRDFNYHNIPYYVMLGIFCGLVSVFYLRTFFATEGLFKRRLRSGFAKLAVGGLLLGVLIVFFPAFFGEGYTSVKALAAHDPGQLFSGSPLNHEFMSTPWTIALAVMTVGLAKVFAVSFTLNGGGNGGNFAPSLLVGSCIGFSFASLVNATGFGNLPTSNFSLVAMAGVLTGIFHAPLTAIFLIAEITGGYDLIIPLMLVAALSTAVSKYFNPKSLDEAKLSQSATSLSFGRDTHILSQLSLQGFIETDFIAVKPGTTLRTLTQAVASSKRNIFPVVGVNGSLEGIIAIEDIRELMFDTSRYDTLKVDQLMRRPVVTANADDDMAVIMEKFDKTGVWNIPVLEENVYIGFVSKSRVFSNYRDRIRD